MSQLFNLILRVIAYANLCSFIYANLSLITYAGLRHRINISNRRATQRCNASSVFYAKICSLLARRRSSQPVQRVYWPENVIDWLGKWRPACVMRHARGQKLQSFRHEWPFCIWIFILCLRSCFLSSPKQFSHILWYSKFDH